MRKGEKLLPAPSPPQGGTPGISATLPQSSSSDTALVLTKVSHGRFAFSAFIYYPCLDRIGEPYLVG